MVLRMKWMWSISLWIPDWLNSGWIISSRLENRFCLSRKNVGLTALEQGYLCFCGESHNPEYNANPGSKLQKCNVKRY